MSSLKTRLLGILATFTCCFRSNEGKPENGSHGTNSACSTRDTMFSRNGSGDNSVQSVLHENTRKGDAPDGNWIMSGEPLGCMETPEQENDEKSSTKYSNIVKVSDSDESSTSTEEPLCFCEGCKVKLRNKYPQLNQLLEIEGDDRRLRDHIECRKQTEAGPNAEERERCIKSAGMVRRSSEETHLDIPSRPHTAEELHRRLCRQLRRAEQRRRHKSKRPDSAVKRQKFPKSNTTKSTSRTRDAEVYVPVSRPPTPIPCGGNCLDDKLLFKRKMSEKVAEIIFEDGEDNDEKESTFAKFSSLRRSRASKRWPRGISVRCRSLSSIHEIRLYASPLQRDTPVVISEKCCVREPGRRGTWPIAGKQPEWPTGRTVLHEANRQKKDVHRRSGKKLTRKTKNKN